jgi:hypothetical protein
VPHAEPERRGGKQREQQEQLMATVEHGSTMPRERGPI